jgi:abortive infection bacteriophage resistance protein
LHLKRGRSYHTNNAPAKPLPPCKTGKAEIGGYFIARMHYTKNALPYEQQLELLKSRGLAIKDEERTLHWLKRVGYYRLSGYFLPFKIPNTDSYKDGVTFDHVIDLYIFDARLRLLTMEAIYQIEVAVRASVTYHCGHQLGPFGYCQSSNFAPFVPATPGVPASGLDFKQFIGLIKKEVEQSNEEFVRHYRGKYTLEEHLPIWMATELMSLGTLSKMAENLRKGLRKTIARDFGISQSQFVSWLHCISYIRNICAHHGRLWNRQLSVKPELLKEWKQVGVQGDRLYCVFLLLQHLLSHVRPTARWKDDLIIWLGKNPTVNPRIMQFPDNWPELEPWKVSPL